MWAVILCFSCVFLILEMMIPGIFFLNFALAGLITAGLSLFIGNLIVLTVLFSVLSLISMYTLRPLLLKSEENRKQQSGIEAKYIGKIAKVAERIDKNAGVLSIYDERWQARTRTDEILEAGDDAKITGYESIVMYVEKV